MTKEEIRKIIQRMPASLHEKAKKAAKSAGMSLNAYINKLVETADEDRGQVEQLADEIIRLTRKVDKISDELNTENSLKQQVVDDNSNDEKPF